MDEKTIKAVLEDLTIEDLNEDLRVVAEMNQHGLEAVRCFLAAWDGERITFPTVRLMNPLMQRYVQRLNREGVSTKEIARRCGRSRRLVAQWIEQRQDSRAAK